MYVCMYVDDLESCEVKTAAQGSQSYDVGVLVLSWMGSSYGQGLQEFVKTCSVICGTCRSIRSNYAEFVSDL